MVSQEFAAIMVLYYRGAYRTRALGLESDAAIPHMAGNLSLHLPD